MDKYACIDLRGFFIKSVMNERRCCHLPTWKRSHTEDGEGTWTTSNTADLIKIGQMMSMDISHQENPEKISTNIWTGTGSGVIKEIKNKIKGPLLSHSGFQFKNNRTCWQSTRVKGTHRLALCLKISIHREKCVESSDNWIRSTVGIWGIKRKKCNQHMEARPACPCLWQCCA